ncbi:MAG: Rap1a/Tai family immunity protein [Candidatus Puniceispirillaceae bacterium]
MNLISTAKRVMISSVFSVFAMMAVPAQADFLTGHDLNTYCTSSAPSDDMICIVYITGAFDAFTTTDLINQKATQASATLCPREDVSPDELKQVTADWLARDESDLNFAATLLVLAALQDKYGCAN